MGSNCTVRGNIVMDNAFRNYWFDPGNKLDLLLCEIPEMIEWPARVTLTGTLRMAVPYMIDGISVMASDVTIDLNGHGLIGSGYNSGHGIYQPSNNYHSVVVKNGFVANWMSYDRSGIHLAGKNNRVEGVLSYSNNLGILTGPGSLVSDCTACTNEGGMLGGGIAAGPGSVVTRCTAYSNRGGGNAMFGIFAADGSVIDSCSAYSNEFFSSTGVGILGGAGAVIRNCSAYGNHGDSMYGLSVINGGEIADCSVFRNVSWSSPGGGINGGDGTVVRNCAVFENETNGSIGFGIGVGSGASVIDCTVYRHAGLGAQNAGIFTLFDSMVRGCTVTGNTNDGIRIGRGCSVLDSTSHGNSRYGIYAVSHGNRIERNFVNENDTGIFTQSSNNFVVANRASDNVNLNYDIAINNSHGPIVNTAGSNDLSLVTGADHPLANIEY
jgi:hypothetical protein